jgi:hypothetical protein
MAVWPVKFLVAVSTAVLVIGWTGCGGSDGGMSTTSVVPASQAKLTGHWRGRLHQKGLDPFTVTAVIASPAGSAGNRVHYTGIDCSGTWTSLGKKGDAFRFREVITHGHGGSCKGVGIVTLKAAGEALGYEFRGGGVISRGTLHRTA